MLFLSWIRRSSTQTDWFHWHSRTKSWLPWEIVHEKTLEWQQDSPSYSQAEKFGFICKKSYIYILTFSILLMSCLGLQHELWSIPKFRINRVYIFKMRVRLGVTVKFPVSHPCLRNQIWHSRITSRQCPRK